jgi:hypothetical protein
MKQFKWHVTHSCILFGIEVVFRAIFILHEFCSTIYEARVNIAQAQIAYQVSTGRQPAKMDC